jgi:hypothetical protein
MGKQSFIGGNDTNDLIWIYISVNHLTKKKTIGVTSNLLLRQESLPRYECIVYYRHFNNVIDAVAYKLFLSSATSETVAWLLTNKKFNELYQL